MASDVSDPSPASAGGHPLDRLPAPLGLTVGLLAGAVAALLLWRLPMLAAAPLYLLALAGAVMLARQGEPRLVPVAPARDEAEPEPEPKPPPRPSLIPADWWVDIPAGEFLMGSPAREVGRYDNEGPQHAVRVSAFRFLRYPVTGGLKRRLEGDPRLRCARAICRWSGSPGSMRWRSVTACPRPMGSPPRTR